MRVSSARVAAFALALAVSATLAGCAEDLAPPPKGVYRGPADQPLDQDTREALRLRSKHQKYN